MTGLPYAFSAHAKDIYTTPPWELTEKMAGAAWGATCTSANWNYLAALLTAPERLELDYHGLDLGRYQAPHQRTIGARLNIVSVCRAVEKKGLGDVLSALAKLPGDLDWRFAVKFRSIFGGASIWRAKKSSRKAPKLTLLPQPHHTSEL